MLKIWQTPHTLGIDVMRNTHNMYFNFFIERSYEVELNISTNSRTHIR